MTEEWKDIPDYENLYQASNTGRIRTCEGKVTSSARSERRVWKQRIMKQKVTKNGKGRYDARICLWKDGKEKTLLVSRVVAMTWCDGYAEGLTVNHIDGNPLNNNCTNLEWVSLADNIRKRFETGLFSKNTKPITLTDSFGRTLEFKSMSEASRFLGGNHGMVSCALKRGSNTVKGYKINAR